MERVLFYLPRPPWNAAYLVPAGFLVFPIIHSFFGDHRSLWTVAIVFFGMLLVLRFTATLLRRMLPFSKDVLSAWSQTRLLAKQYDSFQLQKLFWLGVGIATHAVLSDRAQSAQIAWAASCLIVGGCGAAAWWTKSKGLLGYDAGP